MICTQKKYNLGDEIDEDEKGRGFSKYGKREGTRALRAVAVDGS
jgi:hypothetical protein